MRLSTRFSSIEHGGSLGNGGFLRKELDEARKLIVKRKTTDPESIESDIRHLREDVG